MQGLKYLIIMTKRDYTEAYLEFLSGMGINQACTQLCQGTATHAMLNYFGLEETGKVLIQTFVREEKVEELKKGLKDDLYIDSNGNGMAIFLPIDGIGGAKTLAEVAGEQPLIKESEDMNKDYKAVLIITIADKGNTDLIMQAARDAGATGGTVAKASGTGKDVSKFFGVSLSKEKDMVYIVAKKSLRDDIMHAIMEKAGMNTPARGVVFSLPVDSVEGVKHFEDLK